MNSDPGATTEVTDTDTFGMPQRSSILRALNTSSSHLFVVVAVLGLLQWLKGSLYVPALVGIVLIAVLIGRITAIFLDRRDDGMFLCLPLGTIVLTLLVTALYVAGLSIGVAFVVVTLLVTGLAWRRGREVRKLFTAPRPHQDWLALGVVVLGAFLWSLEYTQAPDLDTVNNTLRFSYFLDTPFLASHIWKFAYLPIPESLANPGMVDVPRYVYHYSVFILGAMFKVTSNAPAVDVLNLFIVPLGYICVSCIAYVVVAASRSRVAGIGALLFIYFLPDPSYYGGSVFFSYHWLNHCTQNMNLSITVVLLAFYLISRSQKKLHTKSLITGVVLTVAVISFKAHFFVVTGPPLLLLAMYYVMRARRRAFWIVTIAIALSGLAVVGSGHTPIFETTLGVNRNYLHFVADYGNTIVPAAMTTPQLIGAIGLAICYAFGFTLLAIVPAVIERRQALSQFVLGGLAVYFLICSVLTIHAGFEFEHRNLVVIHFLCAMLLGGWLADCLARAKVHQYLKLGITVLAAVLGISWAAVQATNVTRRMDSFLNHVAIDRDVYDACIYLRENTDVQAVVISEEVFAHEVFAFSERRFFLNAARLFGEREWGVSQDMIDRRVALKESLFNSRTPEAVEALAAESGIQYAMVVDTGRIPWFGMRHHIVFSQGRTAVFDLSARPRTEQL